MPASSSSGRARKETAKPTSVFARVPIRWLYLATRETFWRVMSVEPVEADEEETFCAVVPEKHAFTLAGGIYTRNCGACEPECPVEAIFPEDALPEKWEPFVKINYAFPDADVDQQAHGRVRARAQRPERADRLGGEWSLSGSTT